MLQGEHSAILSTFIKLPFVIKIFVLSFFEWPFYTCITGFMGLQDHDMGEDEMMKMFAGMGLNGEGAGEGFMPMMQGMMKTLLSKEVLYPSLKEINTKVNSQITDYTF